MRLAIRTAAATLAVLVAGAVLAEEQTAAQPVAGAVVALVVPEDAARSPGAREIDLDRYVGRYDAANGSTFFVDREADALTIDVPSKLGRATMRLRVADEPHSFATTDGTRVAFRTDGAGHVAGLAFRSAGTPEAVAARKAPEPRGIVTVYELSSSPELLATGSQ